MSLAFLLQVLQIIMIDILLGGDNAVVIALACRKLPEAAAQRRHAWGASARSCLRVVLIFFALTLLALPFLKLVGALLLLWIGIKLLQPEDDGDHDIQASDKLMGRGQDGHRGRLRDEPGQRHRHRRRRRGHRRRDQWRFVDLRPTDEHPDHRLGQPDGASS